MSERGSVRPDWHADRNFRWVPYGIAELAERKTPYPHFCRSYQLGKKGGALGALAIDSTKTGGWRGEEEFVNAGRGRETVTHTDFVTAVKYMEWTDAVTLSMRERREVQLPLL